MPSNTGGTKKGSRIPRRARNVGSRTGVAVLAGKNVRKDSRGMDNFEDYFTEKEESDSSNFSILGDKPNVSNENVTQKQPKSSEKSAGKRTSSVSEKNFKIMSRKTPTEQESSDKEDLVIAGTIDGSLTTSRVDKIVSLLHGKQQLSFSASPKPSSASKQASNTNQKQNSPKKPVTSQLNDLQYDSSDEDLFEPIKLNWTLASKRLVSPVHSIKKPATSPVIQIAKSNPYSTPQTTPKPNKRNSLARRSLHSSRDENYIPKHLKLASSEEDSDEEPIPAPMKSPGSTNKKQPHHTGVHAATSPVIQMAKSSPYSAPQMMPKPNTLARRSLHSSRDDNYNSKHLKLASPEEEPIPAAMKYPGITNKKQKHRTSLDARFAEGGQIRIKQHNQRQKASESVSEDGGSRLGGAKSKQNSLVRNLNATEWKSPAKFGNVINTLSPRSKSPQNEPIASAFPTVRQVSKVPERIGSKPHRKLTRRHHKEAAVVPPRQQVALPGNDPKQQDSISESKKSDVEVGAQVAAKSYSFRERPDKPVAVHLSPRKRRSVRGRSGPESYVVGGPDTDTEVAASPPKKARSQQQQLSSPGRNREVSNLLVTTNKQRHRQSALPANPVQAHSFPTVRAAHDRSLSDSETDTRHSTCSPITTKSKKSIEKISPRREPKKSIEKISPRREPKKSIEKISPRREPKKSIEKISPRRELEMEANVNGSLIEERQMAGGKRGSPWSKLLESVPSKTTQSKTSLSTHAFAATNFPEDKPAKKKNKRGGKPSAKTSKKALDDLSRKSAKAPNRRQEQTNSPRKSEVVTKKSVQAAVESLRRSKRNRVPVLARHIGQRIIYKLDSNGLPVVDMIEEGSKHTSKFRYNEKAKKKKPVFHKKDRTYLPKSPVKQIDDSVMANNDMDDDPLEAILVINPETNEEVYVDCIQLKKTFVFVGPNGEKIGRDDPMAISKPVDEKAFSSGIIFIRPRQEKGYHYVQNDAMIFWILRGQLEVTVHETTVILDEMDTFYVPPGNKYNIKNLTDNSVKLLFFQHKREKLD